MSQGQLRFEEIPSSLEQRFRDFHEKNPHVYHALVRLARQLLSKGHRRLGIGMLYEVLRWEHKLATQDPHSNYKLSDNYRSRYARLIMKQEPDLKGVFSTKELRS